MVRDPYWLHVYWEITHHAIERAEAALSQDWHGTEPILRVIDVANNGISAGLRSHRASNIEIHGGCNSWYVDVFNPPHSYRIDIGYLRPERQLLRSRPIQHRHNATSRHERPH